MRRYVSLFVNILFVNILFANILFVNILFVNIMLTFCFVTGDMFVWNSGANVPTHKGSIFSPLKVILYTQFNGNSTGKNKNVPKVWSTPSFKAIEKCTFLTSSKYLVQSFSRKLSLKF